MEEMVEVVKAMDVIIRSMSDESGYFRWINIIPDEMTDEEAQEVCEDRDVFKAVVQTFIDLIGEMVENGIVIDGEVY